MRRRAGRHVRARPRRAQRPRGREWFPWIGWYVLAPLLAGVVLPGATGDLSEAVHAARGEGLRGTLVVTSHHCGKSCDTEGVFTSDDGRVRREVVHAEPPTALRVGSRLRVLVRGDTAYQAQGSTLWVWPGVFAAGCAVVLIGWAISVGTALRRRSWRAFPPSFPDA